MCEPPLDVQRVPAGGQAPPLQRPDLRRRPGAGRDHFIKVELQGSGVLVGALVLVGDIEIRFTRTLKIKP